MSKALSLVARPLARRRSSSSFDSVATGSGSSVAAMGFGPAARSAAAARSFSIRFWGVSLDGSRSSEPSSSCPSMHTESVAELPWSDFVCLRFLLSFLSILSVCPTRSDLTCRDGRLRLSVSPTRVVGLADMFFPKCVGVPDQFSPECVGMADIFSGIVPSGHVTSERNKSRYSLSRREPSVRY